VIESRDVVLKALKETEKLLKAGEIAEKTGLDKKLVDKAMKVLKTEELIVSPKRCYWKAK
jgi:DNA-binding IscR family transcriptional regulator